MTTGLGIMKELFCIVLLFGREVHSPECIYTSILRVFFSPHIVFSSEAVLV